MSTDIHARRETRRRSYLVQGPSAPKICKQQARCAESTPSSADGASESRSRNLHNPTAEIRERTAHERQRGLNTVVTHHLAVSETSMVNIHRYEITDFCANYARLIMKADWLKLTNIF